jgi:hypothetical protein
VGYTSDPLQNLAAAYGTNGADSKPYNSGQGMYNITMYVSRLFFFNRNMTLLIFLCRCIVSATFLVGSLRTNVPFVCAFFGLVFLFGFIAAADFQLGYATTATEAEYSLTLLKVAGGFGFFTVVAGWLAYPHLPRPNLQTRKQWLFPNIYSIQSDNGQKQVSRYHHRLRFYADPLPTSDRRPQFPRLSPQASLRGRGKLCSLKDNEMAMFSSSKSHECVQALNVNLRTEEEIWNMQGWLLYVSEYFAEQ